MKLKMILGISVLTFFGATQTFADCVLSYPLKAERAVGPGTVTFTFGDAQTTTDQCLTEASQMLSSSEGSFISELSVKNTQLEKNGLQLVVKRK